MTEMTQNMISHGPYSLWMLSLADVMRGVFESDLPGVEKN